MLEYTGTATPNRPTRQNPHRYFRWIPPTKGTNPPINMYARRETKCSPCIMWTKSQGAPEASQTHPTAYSCVTNWVPAIGAELFSDLRPKTTPTFPAHTPPSLDPFDESTSRLRQSQQHREYSVVVPRGGEGKADHRKPSAEQHQPLVPPLVNIRYDAAKATSTASGRYSSPSHPLQPNPSGLPPHPCRRLLFWLYTAISKHGRFCSDLLRAAHPLAAATIAV